MSQSCYVCGGYLFRGARHRTCEPRYHRRTYQACTVCGKLARGERHRLCTNPPSEWSQKGSPPADWKPCGYCGAATRGTYHNQCHPIGLDDLAIFADDPRTVQRRCRLCREWFPFAAAEGAERVVTSDMWRTAGLSHGKRPRFDATCRACRAEQRRRTDGTQGTRTPREVSDRILALREAGMSLAETAVAVGLSKRTVARHWARRAA